MLTVLGRPRGICDGLTRREPLQMSQCRAHRFRALVSILFFTAGVSIGSASETLQQLHVDPEEHWAFQKLVRPSPPPVHNASLARSSVDAFVLARLERVGLKFSHEAPRATLIRRAYLDLLGLPPSLEAVDEFVSDTEPDAFERLIDRLLASPRFGERWGRHWLDVVGYVDTVGFDFEPKNIILTEGKWRYRHYVIRSFNADKPYDRFLVEQLAGDELVHWRNAERYTDEIRDHLIATGFWRTAKDFTHEPVSNIASSHYAVLHDTMEIFGSSVLGLTINCARCHSHKFDPISQTDYYRLMALITPAYNPQRWMPVFPYKGHLEHQAKLPDRVLLDVSAAEKAEIDEHNRRIDRQAAELKQQLADLHRPYRQRLFEQKLARLPEVIRADVKTALETDADKRSEIQKYLAGKFEGMFMVMPDEVTAGLSVADKTKSAHLRREETRLHSQRHSYGKIQALFDVGPPPASRLLRGGNHETPGRAVQPGFLSALTDSQAARWLVKTKDASTSGRRTALAQWLTDPESPAAGLVARVMVNRLWQHLFGKGLVETPGNFGASGARPTHPKLLDWLAAELIRNDWHIKPTIRTMMASTVYRQASTMPSKKSQIPNPHSIDPTNNLLWRMRLRRLESEVIRDSILTVSGKLNVAMGGPPVPVLVSPDGMVSVDEPKLRDQSDRWRRSVYLLARRTYQLSMLTVFDQPSISTTCARRDVSAGALQSLTMLNAAFIFEHADILAARAGAQAESTDERIEIAFRLVLARKPNLLEMQVLSRLHEEQSGILRAEGIGAQEIPRKALAHVCHALLNTSEFLYAE